MLNKWLKFNLSPNSCLLCGNLAEASALLCRDCHDDLPYLAHCCRLCARPLPAKSPSICGNCLNNIAILDKTLAVFEYRKPIDHIIHQFKFGQQVQLDQWLANQLARRAQDHYSSLPDCLIPVPLFRQRTRERGYNQSLLLARQLGRQLAIPVDYSSCYRVRNTPPQSELPAKQRRKNIKGAFDLSKPLKHGHIALIDDVMTTGSTLRELASLLKSRGVNKVDAWVIARTSF